MNVRIFAYSHLPISDSKGIKILIIYILLIKKIEPLSKLVKANMRICEQLNFPQECQEKRKQGIGSPERGISKYSQRFNYQGIYFSARLFVPLATPKVLSLEKTKENEIFFGLPMISGDRNTDTDSR